MKADKTEWGWMVIRAFLLLAPVLFVSFIWVVAWSLAQDVGSTVFEAFVPLALSFIIFIMMDRKFESREKG